MALQPKTTELTREPFFETPPNYAGDPEAHAASINQYLANQFRLIQFLIGGSLRWQNLRSQLVSTGDTNQPANSGAAGSLMTFQHDLGKIPEFYVWNVEGAPTNPAADSWHVYHTAADKANWTTQTIDVRLSGTDNPANESVTLLVM